MKKDKLFNDFKKRVAISNFKEEYEREGKQEMKKLKLANIAAVLAVVVVIGNPIFYNIIILYFICKS